MKKSIAIVYFLLIISTFFTQQFNFKNYTISEGLPQSSVYDIFQDSKGQDQASLRIAITLRWRRWLDARLLVTRRRYHKQGLKQGLKQETKAGFIGS